MTAIIVMTVIGDVPRQSEPMDDSTFPAPPGFSWRFVPESRLADQIRSILRMDARAVVVWVGTDHAAARAAALIGRLLGAGVPMVIAIAQVHEHQSETVLRQAGALYICANEAEQRLGSILEALFAAPSRARDPKTIAPGRKIRMDAS
jgi:hypothetical protein